jgi:hypothetical protein
MSDRINLNLTFSRRWANLNCKADWNGGLYSNYDISIEGLSILTNVGPKVFIDRSDSRLYIPISVRNVHILWGKLYLGDIDRDLVVDAAGVIMADTCGEYSINRVNDKFDDEFAIRITLSGDIKEPSCQ